MVLSKNLLRISSLFIVFTIAVFSTSATTKYHKSGTKKNKHAKVVGKPKTVKLVQSKESIELPLNNGESASLPKVDKVLADGVVPSISLANKMFNDDASSTSLFEKLAEQKEMEELSDILGVEIKEASNLNLYREVADWLGTRYRRGGMSRKAVDCSGFTNIIYKNVYDMKLDRVSTVIAKNLKVSVSKDDLLPGDMVFFSTLGRKYINHVGVYLGNGLFAHASIKKGVVVSSLLEGYYNKAWRKGGRME